MKKLILLVLTSVLLMSLLTGCTGDGKTLYNALFEKQYVASKTDLSLNYKLSGEGFKDEQWPSFLNNLQFNINYDILSKTSEDNKKLQMSAKTKSTFGKDDLGIFAGLDVWADMDLSDSSNPKFIETIRYPELFRYFLGMQANKKFEFIQIDLFKIYEQIPELNPSNILDIMKRIDPNEQKELLQKALADISVPIQTKSLPESKKEFTIKLTDKETMKLFNDTLKAIVKSKYLDRFLEPSIKNNLFTKEEADKNIDKFLTELDKITYIGNEGSEFTFVVDKNEYLETTNSTINFRFSTKEITSFINSFVDKRNQVNMEEVPDAYINLQVSTNAKITKLPDSTQIEFPKTTNENTLDYQKFIDDIKKKTVSYMAPTKDPLEIIDKNRAGITLYRSYGGSVELGSPGILEINGVKMVPVRKCASALGVGTIVYDDESQNIWITNYNKNIKIKVGSSTAYVNGEQYEYGNQALFIGDTVYVPLDLLTDNSMYIIKWYQTEGGWAGVIEYKYENIN